MPKAENGAELLLTDEVRAAGAALLEALSEACERSGLTRDQAEARLSLLIANLGDDLDRAARRLPRQRAAADLPASDQLISAGGGKRRERRTRSGRPPKGYVFQPSLT